MFQVETDYTAYVRMMEARKSARELPPEVEVEEDHEPPIQPVAVPADDVLLPLPQS